MKIPVPHLLLSLCCALTLVAGCMPMAGPRPYPIGYPGQPIGYYPPQPWPGQPPGHHVGYPPFPGGPGIPIVLNPSPPVDTVPPFPDTPSPNPDTPPTIPVTDPQPVPSDPGEDPTDFWSPWPLPPHGDQFAAHTIGFTRESASVANGNTGRHQLAGDVSATENEDLRYRGGRTIQNLAYINLYVSGDTEWSKSDVEQIDRSLSAAMSDQHLNNVLLQYYKNQPISSRALPSHPLVGYTPQTVTRGDIQQYLTYLFENGYLDPYDPQNTVFNFLLPAGTVLTTDLRPANSGQEAGHSSGVPEADVSDSLTGMAGYHGSVVTAAGGRLYFAVGVYSERFTDGSTNGIPVFAESWKNVVATLYHQMIETRTDPDVEDAIRDSFDLNSDHNLGWVSDSGLEIGDFPINSGVPLTSVIREVPLADGSGYVPVQLPYSNFVHGPEGPIARPHPLP